MNWLTIAKLALTIADKLLDIARAKQLISAGEDRQIAKATATILSKTEVGKQIDLRAAGLTEAQVDEELKELEPK